MTRAVYAKGKQVDERIFLAFAKDSRRVGVFESLRTYGRKIFMAPEHIARLIKSAKTAGLSCPLGERELIAELETAAASYRKSYPAAAAEDLFLRLTVFESRCFVIVGSRRHTKALYEQGVHLRTSPVRRSFSNAAFPEAKTADYQNAVLASLEPRANDIYEWLFLDRSGFVTEVRIGNIFAVQKIPGRSDSPGLVTPPAHGLLNGLTRRFVIKCALRAGIPVREEPLTRHNLFNAAEVFLTNTSWEVLPVVTLDGRTIGTGSPGPLTRNIHGLFREHIAEEYS